MEIYSHDEVTDPAYHHMPEAVVFAENAQQVAAVVKLANEYIFPVVPRGAGTGLACGAVPIYGGVVLSLEKMNKIIEVNADAMYAVVERVCAPRICRLRLKLRDLLCRRPLQRGFLFYRRQCGN